MLNFTALIQATYMNHVYRLYTALLWFCFFTFKAEGQSSIPCEPDSVYNPVLIYGSMSDQEGNTYKTVVIGTKEWMAENLKVSKYRNGTPIPNLTSTNWTTTNSGAWCWYKNDSAVHHCPYGKLYNWFAVDDTRKICPTGWHVPTYDEWVQLESLLGGSESAGGKMKSQGLQYWSGVNLGASNFSGFSGLPGGFRYGVSGVGTFDFKGTVGYWWSASASPNTPGTAFFRGLLNDSPSLLETNFIYRCGMSVRCVNDLPVSGIKARRHSDALAVVHNPTEDFVRVMRLGIEEELHYTLFTLEGRVLLSGKLEAKESIIWLQGIPKGLYFLQFGKDGRTPTKLMIE